MVHEECFLATDKTNDSKEMYRLEKVNSIHQKVSLHFWKDAYSIGVISFGMNECSFVPLFTCVNVQMIELHALVYRVIYNLHRYCYVY